MVVGQSLHCKRSDLSFVHFNGRGDERSPIGKVLLDALGLTDFQNSLIPHRETFADVGEVQMYVDNMHKVWERLKDRVRIEVRPEEALLIREYVFPIPASILWEYMTKPEYRAILLGVPNVELRNQAQGRTAVDSVYLCYHGKMESQHCILDWQPYEGYTINSTTPLGVNFNMTYNLVPTADGTRLINLYGKSQGPRIMCIISNLLQKIMFAPQTDKNVELLRQRIQQDLADGTAFVSPPIEVDNAQVASLAMQTLTHDH